MNPADTAEAGRVRARAYYYANREKVLAYQREYRAANRDRIAARGRERYRANPEPHKQQARAWEAANPERAAALHTAWRAANVEKMRAHRRAWKKRHPEKVGAWEEANPEKMRGYKRAWKQANPDKVRADVRLRGARRRAVTVLNFTQQDLVARLSMFAGCWLCGDQPEAVDHVKPLAKGGPHMLANLRPICTPCNSRKRDRWPYPP